MTIFAAASIAQAVGGGVGYYRSLTSDHTKLGSSDVANFPVLLDVTDATLKSVSNGGHVQRTDGFDLWVSTTSSGSTKVDFERELYDPATGHFIAWIKAPSLSHTSDSVYGYLRYGDSTITTDQSNAAGTWSNSYVRVVHLGDGSSISGTDSTGNGNFTATGGSAATGKIRGGVTYTGTTAYLNNNAAAVSTFPLTISAWVKLADTSFGVGEERIIAAVVKKSGLDEFWLSYYESTGIQLRTVAQQAGTAWALLEPPTRDTNWHYCVGTFTDSATQAVYQDGALLAGGGHTGSSGQSPASLSDTYIGAFYYNTSNFYSPMKGTIDEVHFASVARSADWIKAEYNNQNSPSTFTTLGAETHE